MREEIDSVLETIDEIVESTHVPPGVSWSEDYYLARLATIRQLAAGALVELRDLALLAEAGGIDAA